MSSASAICTTSLCWKVYSVEKPQSYNVHLKSVHCYGIFWMNSATLLTLFLQKSVQNPLHPHKPLYYIIIAGKGACCLFFYSSLPVCCFTPATRVSESNNRYKSGACATIACNPPEEASSTVYSSWQQHYMGNVALRVSCQVDRWSVFSEKL